MWRFISFNVFILAVRLSPPVFGLLWSRQFGANEKEGWKLQPYSNVVHAMFPTVSTLARIEGNRVWGKTFVAYAQGLLLDRWAGDPRVLRQYFIPAKSFEHL